MFKKDKRDTCVIEPKHILRVNDIILDDYHNFGINSLVHILEALRNRNKELQKDNEELRKMVRELVDNFYDDEYMEARISNLGDKEYIVQTDNIARREAWTKGERNG